MTTEETFEKTAKTTVKRGREQAGYSKTEIYDILDSAYLCHIAYIINGMPHMNPTVFWRKDDYVYWHGSAGKGMLDEQTRNPEVCFNVSHLDGLLLGPSAFHHSANYRSVTIFGKSEVVENEVEKIAAIDHMIESFYPGRQAELRGHKNNEIKAVKVLRLPIKEASAKQRYDHSILDVLNKSKNYSSDGYGEDSANPDCWTGLVPVRNTMESPIPDAATRQGLGVPDYLTRSRFKKEF